MSWAVAGAGTEKVSCDVAWVLGSEHESARTPRAARGGSDTVPDLRRSALEKADSVHGEADEHLNEAALQEF